MSDEDYRRGVRDGRVFERELIRIAGGLEAWEAELERRGTLTITANPLGMEVVAPGFVVIDETGRLDEAGLHGAEATPGAVTLRLRRAARGGHGVLTPLEREQEIRDMLGDPWTSHTQGSWCKATEDALLLLDAVRAELEQERKDAEQRTRQLGELARSAKSREADLARYGDALERIKLQRSLIEAKQIACVALAGDR